MIHCWADNPAIRSRPIVGNAMFTTVPSMKVIDEPTMVAIRVSRRRSARAGSSGAARATPLNDTHPAG